MLEGIFFVFKVINRFTTDWCWIAGDSIGYHILFQTIVDTKDKQFKDPVVNVVVEWGVIEQLKDEWTEFYDTLDKQNKENGF
jgi:hypothetical protein